MIKALGRGVEVVIFTSRGVGAGCSGFEAAENEIKIPKDKISQIRGELSAIMCTEGEGNVLQVQPVGLAKENADIFTQVRENKNSNF